MMLWSTAAAADEIDTYIPELAYRYAPVLKQQQQQYWSDHPRPEVLAGLIEQESCITLHHAKCWNPNVQLKTKREQAIGLGQLTRTRSYDSLAGMRRVHARELSELSWATIAQRPDLQIRTMLMMEMTDWKAFYMVTDPESRMAFVDAAYNGGQSGVRKDRLRCGLTAGCNPQYWFGHVERTCSKSKKAIYGKRGPCDINRDHVLKVLKIRSPKYHGMMSS